METLEEILVYAELANPWVRLFFDRVRFASGIEGRYNRIVEQGGKAGVAVLPLRRGYVGLVEQYRYPVGRTMLEIPRGFGETDEPQNDAARELLEETGLIAERFEDLGIVHANSGLLSGHVCLYAAHLSTTSSQPHDAEIDRFEWLALDTLLDRIRRNEITDGFTLAAVLRAQLFGLFS